MNDETDLKPWVVDAASFNVKESVLNFTSRLFHRTNLTDRYLSPSNTNELIVVAPKGYGKTLMLKAKRVAVAKNGVACLPDNALVDKPGGVPAILAKKNINSISENEDYWVSIWQMAIILTIIKKFPPSIELSLSDRVLQPIYDNELLKCSCDIFNILIGLSHKDYFIARKDLAEQLIPVFRTVHTPVYLFIDNIDEFFERHLASGESRDSISGVLEKSFWYHSQLGLVEAARQLQGINSHVKICVSIRKEVVQLTIAKETGSQLRSLMVDISYERQDLLDIFHRNINAESRDNLANNSASDPFEKFVGLGSCLLEHPSTGDEEEIKDYLLRHTLRRPRDIAELGGAISNIHKDRRTQRAINDSVNEKTREIAETYLSGCAPHLIGFDYEVLFPLVNKNVLTRDELADISSQYQSQASRIGRTGSAHVFCQLYKIGLLGFLRSTRARGVLKQTFLKPGEGPPDSEGILPESQYFLIHSVLDSLIASRNDEYRANLDGLNVIENGRKWRKDKDVSFVLKGDVVGYSEIMNDPDLADGFVGSFGRIVFEASKPLKFGEVDGGDGVLLIDPNPVNLINAAKTIAHGLKASIFQRTMRFGGASGLVTIKSDGESPTARGLAIRKAARIEPFSTPSYILCDADFVSRAQTFGGIPEFSEVDTESHPRIPFDDDEGRFDVSKGPNDAQILVELYEIPIGSE